MPALLWSLVETALAATAVAAGKHASNATAVATNNGVGPRPKVRVFFEAFRSQAVWLGRVPLPSAATKDLSCCVI